jgi:enoyl-CoA hydratase/carnithine racemase
VAGDSVSQSRLHACVVLRGKVVPTGPAFESIRVIHDERVIHIELHRPDRLNALSRQTLLELNACMDSAEADVEIRAVVISGAGRAFSSGFDLKEQMERAPSGPEAWREILDLDFRTTMRFWHCPKPTIAAVHGPCLAGAFELALACDLTIAAQGAIFGEPELKFGAGIVTMLLPWMVGPKQAKEIILLGLDGIDARAAQRLGIANRVVPPGAHVETAMRIARNIAAIDPQLVQDTKQAINRSYEARGMEQALQCALDVDHAIESHGSPDKRRFMDIARASGLKSALAWRDARFAEE